jgi:hypothetical protein
MFVRWWWGNSSPDYRGGWADWIPINSKYVCRAVVQSVSLFQCNGDEVQPTIAKEANGAGISPFVTRLSPVDQRVACSNYSFRQDEPLHGILAVVTGLKVYRAVRKRKRE